MDNKEVGGRAKLKFEGPGGDLEIIDAEEWRNAACSSWLSLTSG